jgi:putative ABC transport system permease protein
VTLDYTSAMLVDLLHLSRTLRRSPASAVAAVLTLSLTLGAGASIFAVVDAVLLTPPPFANPDALVIIGETPIDALTAAPRAVSYATFEAWRERAESLAAVEAFDGTNLTLTELGAAERVSASNVTPGFLTLLGVTPARGRAFDLDDAGRPVAIISHAFWRAKLAADPGVIGRQVVLGGQGHTIVGVLPEQFFFALSACDVWRPFPVTPAQAARTGYRVLAVARLARNVSPAYLGAALDDVSRTSSPPARVVATGVATAIAGDSTRTLALLAGAAALAMLIAFTNLAGLLIVRSIDRRRELAVRSALGARRSEIARQLLLEAAALVAMGILGGVLLALGMTPAVGRLALEQFGDLAGRDVTVSWRVIGVVSIVASACAWICGSLPALVAARLSVVDVLRRGATPPPRERLLRRAFVTGEVALAFVLLTSVMLVGRSLRSVLNVNPGFDARGVLTLSVSVPAARYTTLDRVVSFYSALQSALEERLGPHTIAIVDELPLTGDRGRSLVSARPTDVGREAVVREAGTAYFDVMRIPIVAGRSFDRRDNSSAPQRVVVSEWLAKWLFAFEQPIGRQIWLAATAQVAEIVGVAGDVKHRALDEAPAPTVYLSAWQSPSRSRHVVVRSARPDADVIAAVREEVARLDRDLPVYSRRSMRDVVAVSPGVPARRVLTAAFLGFALLAVVLGGIGLFGVVAHDVACRRRELGIRIALGADPRRIMSATLGQGGLMVGFGLAAGSVLSIWAARALSGVTVATDRFDALSMGVAAAVLMVAGAGAVLPAAWRAARTDPLIALRSE